MERRVQEADSAPSPGFYDVRAAHEAVKRGDVETLARISREAPHVIFAWNNRLGTIAHAAVKLNNYEIVQFLLEIAPGLFMMRDGDGKVAADLISKCSRNYVSDLSILWFA